MRPVSIALGVALLSCNTPAGTGADGGATPSASSSSSPARTFPPSPTVNESVQARPLRPRHPLVATVNVVKHANAGMLVPKKRSTSPFCKDKAIPHNALVVQDGKLADVWVGIETGQLAVQGTRGAVVLDQKDCVYEPRVLGVIVGQTIEIRNSDDTVHNVNARTPTRSLFNVIHPKKTAPLKKHFDDPGIYRFQCDSHPWMRAFAVVTDNPYHAVTDKTGKATIERIPAGKYRIVAWHSLFGRLEQEVTVGPNATVTFTFRGDEEPPEINAGELDDLF